MVSKNDFVNVLVENGGKFDTDLRVWTVPNKNRNDVKKFLGENVMLAVVSDKDNQFVKVFCDDGKIVYVRYEKKYQKKGDYHVFCESVVGKGYTFECGNWNVLKKYVSRVKSISRSVRVYDDNGFAVAKSLWV